MTNDDTTMMLLRDLVTRLGSLKAFLVYTYGHDDRTIESVDSLLCVLGPVIDDMSSRVEDEQLRKVP